MKKDNIILVTGGRGKLGRLLVERPNFVFLDCDVTNIASIHEANGKTEEYKDVHCVVNLASISSVNECEKDYDKAIQVNVHGLANLHKVFGERVLNISSDQVFSGKSIFLPDEYGKANPINSYGFSKMGAEVLSRVYEGKTLRLSRTVGLSDMDILTPIAQLGQNHNYSVPTFFTRNYMHREFAVDAIEYMVRNWDDMPQIVNYGGTDHISMYRFMWELAVELGLDPDLLGKNNKYDTTMTPRPKNGGFKVGLAKELGFPMHTIDDTLSRLKDEFNE